MTPRRGLSTSLNEYGRRRCQAGSSPRVDRCLPRSGHASDDGRGPEFLRCVPRPARFRFLEISLPPSIPRRMGGLLIARSYPAGFLVSRWCGVTVLNRKPTRARSDFRRDGATRGCPVIDPHPPRRSDGFSSRSPMASECGVRRYPCTNRPGLRCCVSTRLLPAPFLVDCTNGCAVRVTGCFLLSTLCQDKTSTIRKWESQKNGWRSTG